METQRCLDILRRRCAIVVPVYLPQGVDQDLGAELLRDNVRLCLEQLEDPRNLCLSVDGPENGAEVAQRLHEEWGVSLHVGPDNGGKLMALRRGAAALSGVDFDYLAVVDADGDHFANELLNFVRAAEFARNRAGAAEIMVLGRRISRHRPMGFLRGELEELADRVLLDALAYNAAKKQEPLRLECATALEEFPDFHSGFKLFSRGTADAVFLSTAQPCGVETAYYRHGVEAAMTVEALEHGAFLVLVNRTTLNEQPLSTFGRLDRARLVADKMIWPCRRLQIPVKFADQWLKNHMPRLLLTTLNPQGKEELLQIRRLVVEELGGEVGADEDFLWGPMFV
jgi:hypothetical protein